VGNTFTVANWLSSSSTSIRTNLVDNVVTSRFALAIADSPNPGVATNLNRTVLEVASNATGVAIQNAINSAGNGTVVHVPWGNHGCSSTVVIPGNKSVVLVGDGPGSQFVWNGPGGTGPLLQMPYPSQATLAHLGFDGYRRALPLIQVDGIGSLSARVLLKDCWITSCSLNNVQIGDCPNASVEQQSVSCQYSTTPTANNVVLEGRGKMRWFCTDTGDIPNNFVCTNGGSLYVETQWQEADGSGHVGAKLSGNSAASFVSTKFAINSTQTSTNGIRVADFSGKFLFALSGNLTDWLKCSGSGNGNVWALGGNSLSSLGQPYLTNASTSITLIESMNQWQSSTGTLKLPDKGTANPAWVRSLTAQARSEYPTFLPYPRLAGQTDVLLNRVFVSQGQVNVWVKP
jgi:hypothetical protein